MKGMHNITHSMLKYVVYFKLFQFKMGRIDLDLKKMALDREMKYIYQIYVLSQSSMEG